MTTRDKAAAAAPDIEAKTTVSGLIALARPRQWIKNGFVFAPLVFTGRFFDPESVMAVVAAALLFCLASSATYALNDLRDVEADRTHPVKRRTRPIAAGRVSRRAAVTWMVALYALVAIGFAFVPRTTLVIVVYLALNVLYTYKLKYQPVLDLFTIAAGFVLRVFAGATALDVVVSDWMFVTTLCLALFLAAMKRRQELLMSGSSSRPVLQRYSVPLTERFAEMSGTGALLFYSLFVITVRPALAWTIPFVIFGLFRYWYIVDREEGGASPTEALLTDVQLLLTVVGWIVSCLWAIRSSGGTS